MKPACIPPVINDTCIDPTPDGVTCFSYTHCLNVRSGITYYNPDPHTNPCQYAYDDPADGCQNYDPCDPTNKVSGECMDAGGRDYVQSLGQKTLPRTGAHFEILLPIVFTVIVFSAWLILKRLIKS